MESVKQFCEDTQSLLEVGDFDEALGLAESGLQFVLVTPSVNNLSAVVLCDVPSATGCPFQARAPPLV